MRSRICAIDSLYRMGLKMANFEFRLEFLDGDGSRVKRTYYVTAADRATAEAKIQGLAEAAQNLILGAIVGADIVEQLDIAGWSLLLPADAASDKEIKGVFKGVVTGGYNYETSLPTFDIATYTLPGGAIDMNNNNVYAFAQTGLALGGFTDYRYADITAITSGKEKIG